MSAQRPYRRTISLSPAVTEKMEMLQSKTHSGPAAIDRALDLYAKVADLENSHGRLIVDEKGAAALSSPDTRTSFVVEAELLRRNHLRQRRELLEKLERPISDQSFASIVAGLVEIGMTQSEISEALGTSKPTISRWVRGENLPRSPLVRNAVATDVKRLMDAVIAVTDEKAAPLSKRRS